MNCVRCSLYLSHVRAAEYIIKGMSLCGDCFNDWGDGEFDVEDVEKGNESGKPNAGRINPPIKANKLN